MAWGNGSSQAGIRVLAVRTKIFERSDGSSLIDASISVRELNERLSMEIPESSQYVTLAGFLLSQSGKLLKEGEEIAWNGHTFRIEEIMGRRIMRVRYAPGGEPDRQAEAG